MVGSRHVETSDKLLAFCRERRGAVDIEYAFIAALLTTAIVTVASLSTALHDRVDAAFDNVFRTTAPGVSAASSERGMRSPCIDVRSPLSGTVKNTEVTGCLGSEVGSAGKPQFAE